MTAEASAPAGSPAATGGTPRGTDPSSWADVEGFVRGHLPPPPARVLEVGCGSSGKLALALAAAGWNVTAIDPEAPEGAPFVRTTLEAFEPPDEEPFDAAVAVLSLHHLADLSAGVEKLRSLLRPGGALVVDEFAKENLVSSEEALGWLYHQRLSLMYAGRDPGGDAGGLPSGDTLESWSSRVSERTSGIHRGREVLAALEERFARRCLSYGPFLYRMGLDDALEPMERSLVEEGGLKPAGLRWVGVSGDERATSAGDA